MNVDMQGQFKWGSLFNYYKVHHGFYEKTTLRNRCGLF